MARPEGDMGTSKERRRVGSTSREAKTQKLVLTVLAVLAVSPIIMLSLYTVPEDNYRGGEMYSTPKLRQAYEVVNAFEYPMNAGMVAEPCAPGKPLLNVILSGVDPPPELHKLSDARKAEYQDAVLRTMRNPEVKRLHIMAERDLMPGWIAELESRDPISYRTKVFLGRTRVGRLSFSYAIRYANEELKSGEVVLLTNADLAVEGGFGCENLSEEKLFQNTVLIPQRLEDDMCDRHLAKTCDARNFVGKVSLPSCFDSYVFRAPLKPEEITEERFGLLIGGEWQAENSFIKELRGIGVSVYSPPGGLLRLVHKHCSQERPNQHASQEMVRGKRREASDDRVCYEPFCGRTCMRNTIPFPDILTNICRDLDLCKEYAEKMRSMRSMANPAKELMTEHAEFCDYDPVVVMQQEVLSPAAKNIATAFMLVFPRLGRKMAMWSEVVKAQGRICFYFSASLNLGRIPAWLVPKDILLALLAAADLVSFLLPFALIAYASAAFVWGQQRVGERVEECLQRCDVRIMRAYRLLTPRARLKILGLGFLIMVTGAIYTLVPRPGPITQ